MCCQPNTSFFLDGLDVTGDATPSLAIRANRTAGGHTHQTSPGSASYGDHSALLPGTLSPQARATLPHARPCLPTRRAVTRLVAGRSFPNFT